MKLNFLRCLFLFLSLITVAWAADDLKTVRGRMEKRLPAIDALKEQGVVGENNRGLLELRGEGAGAAGVVQSENSDRETVYAALAAQTNTTVEQVARARARQLAAASRGGVWVQDQNGAWKKK